MKCRNCGADMPEDQEVCSVCGTAAAGEETVEAAAAETETVAEDKPEAAAEEPAAIAEPEVAEPEPETAPAPKKKRAKVIVGAFAAAAVVAAGAFGVVKMTEKDPKQVVIEAFESVYPEGQVYPIDELFGVTKFSETSGTVDSEGGMTLKLDSCSSESANAYAGSGMRISGKNDITNKKSSAEIAAIYNGMDLAKLQFYYGDDMLKAALPELSGKVFTLDLGDGLADRMVQSPFVGPLLKKNNVDVKGMAEFFTQVTEEAKKNQETGKGTYDFEGVWNRYKEGSKAQENFKAALTVEKGEKKTFTVDGSEVSCKGYQVAVSKASMMDFLRTSSDFFLQDEELKKQYIRQLEMTVKMSGLVGGNASGTEMPSAEELQQQTYEEAQESVKQMLDSLDATLDDVAMTVYVDKKGRLAAVDGATVLHGGDNAEDSAEGSAASNAADSANVAFHLELSGGTYLTQNAVANVTMTDVSDEGHSVTVDLYKQGTYDGKQLTSDWSMKLASLPEDEKYNFMYTGTYNSDGGDYHVAMAVGDGTSQLLELSALGAVDSLEKGTSIHVNLDALEVSAQDGLYSAVLSGECEYKPLAGEVTPPEGEDMDVLAATQEEWQSVVMGMIYGAFGLLGQLGVS